MAESSFTKADLIMAKVILESGKARNLKQSDMDAACGALKAAKDFETLAAFQELYSGNLSAYNKTLAAHAIIAPPPPAKEAKIVRLEAAMASLTPPSAS
jgi:hypothetical protein